MDHRPQKWLPFADSALDLHRLADPLRWTAPRLIRLNGDLFAPSVSASDLVGLVGIMALATRHRFTLRTEHGERMRLAMEAIGTEPDPAAFCVGHAFAEWYSVLGPQRLVKLAPATSPAWPLANVTMEGMQNGYHDSDRRQRQEHEAEIPLYAVG